MKNNFPVVLLLFVGLVLAAGLLQLFRLRFAEGDVYPEYSSLRADPLGTMAFCESLEKMPGISVRRDLSATGQLPEGKDTTYLHLAAQPVEWKSIPEATAKEIEGFLVRGGRLAITMFPQTTKPWRTRDDFVSEDSAPDESGKARENTKGKPSRSARKKKLKQEEDSQMKLVSLKDRWGFDFGFAALPESKNNSYEPATVANKTDLALPETLGWHSGTIFSQLAKAWQVVYARGTNPVVIERQWGAGRLVIATDSYFLSNEAMRKDRNPDLLAWLVGPSKQVVFDEAHLGIVATSGVAGLIRKYHLHGLMAALILVAGLFIWKNAVSFVPPYSEQQEEDFVAGKEGAAGFVNLLRRNVPAKDVLKTCFAEWNKTITRGGKYSAARVARARALAEADAALPPRERDPLRTYQEICRVLDHPGI